MHTTAKDALTKVPAITPSFWIVKILAMTPGETGGDTILCFGLLAAALRPFGIQLQP